MDDGQQGATVAPALDVVHHDGEEPVVVLVHGAMDRGASFARVARRLTGRAVVRYDRRGYAGSGPLGAGTLDHHVADLASVVAGRPTVVVGHSAGGVIALVLAARAIAPLVGLVVVEAPTPWTSWWPGPTEPETASADPGDEAEAFMRRMVGDRTWERLPAATRAARRAEGPALRADLDMVQTATPPCSPADVAVPVLSLAGTATTWWHRRAAEELATAVPRGRFGLIDGAGHGSHLTHPTALAAAVDAFARTLR